MNKKWVALGLTSVLLLGACSKEEEKETKKEETPVEQKETKKEVKGLSPEQIDQLNLNEKTEISDGVLKVTVTLKNQGIDKLPLLLDDNQGLIVQLIGQDGKEIDKAVFEEKDRTSINAKESLTYQYEYELDKDYGEYKIKLRVPLLNEEGERAEEELKLEVSVDYERPITYTYMPSEPKTLIYENHDGSGVDYREEFMFFDGGYAQSYNTVIGGSVVYYSDDKGYYRVYNEVSQRKVNVLNEITPREQVLLPLPVEQGKTWEMDNVTHTIVEDSITINTAYGKLSGVAIVEADIGRKVRFYYHPSFGMVKTEVQDDNGNFQPLYELKSVQ